MSKFLRLKCECGNIQVTFGSASMKVKCQACDKVLIEPTGGFARINEKVELLEILG